jgi:hypothetical protein
MSTQVAWEWQEVYLSGSEGASTIAMNLLRREKSIIGEQQVCRVLAFANCGSDIVCPRCTAEPSVMEVQSAFHKGCA